MLRHTGTHPNLVRFYGAVTLHQTPKIVLELCDRGDLFHIVRYCVCVIIYYANIRLLGGNARETADQQL